MPSRQPLLKPVNYAGLKRDIAAVLEEGMRRAESLKLEYYWRVGRVLALYLLRPGLAESDEAVVKRLAADLHLDSSHLYRVLQFARECPELSQAEKSLSWSHHKELLSVSDTKKRKQLILQAVNDEWSVRDLRLQIQKERGPKLKTAGMPQGLLAEPERLEPGIRQVRKLDEMETGSRLVVDLGFDLYSPLQGTTLKPDATVRWDSEKEKWVSAGTVKELYYYRVKTERVVDGDTLLVHIDAAPFVLRRQYLRLRGLNAEEMNTPAGKKAASWLTQKIKAHPEILIRTHLTDRYDRYIADCWAGDEYVNNALLTSGLASRAYE